MNFQLLGSGYAVDAVLNELHDNMQLFGDITIRQTLPGSAHHDTETIFLRGPAEFTHESYMERTDAYDYPALAELPATTALLRTVLADIGVTDLGYVLIVSLMPGGVIDEHIDTGAYAAHYDRFHLVLTSDPGNVFTCGGEALHMQPGTCWRFNHRAPHAVRNDSDRERIHVIFDARCT